jgi:CYTH domain-containing protein
MRRKLARFGPKCHSHPASLSCRNEAISLRIRIKNNTRATLTIKSAAAKIGRQECEYEIPLEHAAALFELLEGGVVEKLRYELPKLS